MTRAVCAFSIWCKEIFFLKFALDDRENVILVCYITLLLFIAFYCRFPYAFNFFFVIYWFLCHGWVARSKKVTLYAHICLRLIEIVFDLYVGILSYFLMNGVRDSVYSTLIL